VAFSSLGPQATRQYLHTFQLIGRSRRTVAAGGLWSELRVMLLLWHMV